MLIKWTFPHEKKIYTSPTNHNSCDSKLPAQVLSLLQKSAITLLAQRDTIFCWHSSFEMLTGDFLREFVCLLGEIAENFVTLDEFWKTVSVLYRNASETFYVYLKRIETFKFIKITVIFR